MNNLKYIDKHLELWEDSISGNLPIYFVHSSNEIVRNILLDRDKSFTFYQYKHFVDTGEDVSLLP